MPGSNAGTGRPLCFKCPKCGARPGQQQLIKATGRTRPLTSAQQGHGGSRVLMYRAQYMCRTCGHMGWSRHVDMESYAGAEPPKDEAEWRARLGVGQHNR